jgi:hypothetical protein
MVHTTSDAAGLTSDPWRGVGIAAESLLDLAIYVKIQNALREIRTRSCEKKYNAPAPSGYGDGGVGIIPILA